MKYIADEHLLPRRRISVAAGEPPAFDAEPEKREQINHVYLAPLRDAQYELDSAAGNRLSNIVKNLVAKESREDFLSKANDSLKELEGHPALTKTSSTVQGHLTKLTSPVRQQNLGIGFESFKLHRLTRSLRIKMAEHGIDLADLSESGLGYANLLYLATVILELSNAEDSELTLFLVEEPEAHLHPQLQAVLLDYLFEQAKNSLHDDSSRPAGRIQVIASTHSPNLTAAVGIENVVALKTTSIEKSELATDGETAQVFVEVSEPSSEDAEEREPHSETDHFHNTVALPLAHANLTAREFRKINQYLDATRAELLFAPRAILVEGISEAVLLPKLARIALDDEQLRGFQGLSVICVGSVDFEPYIKLLAQPINGIPLADKLAVLTDRDPDLVEDTDEDREQKDEDVPQSANGGEVAGEKADDVEKTANPAETEVVEGDRGATSRLGERGARLEALAPADENDVLCVRAASFTLEADLLAAGGNNEAVLREAFLRQRPRSAHRWNAIAGADSPPLEFYSTLRKDKKFIAKGEFAHDIALLISHGEEFSCPPYIDEAVRHVLSLPSVDCADSSGSAES